MNKNSAIQECSEGRDRGRLVRTGRERGRLARTEREARTMAALETKLGAESSKAGHFCCGIFALRAQCGRDARDPSYQAGVTIPLHVMDWSQLPTIETRRLKLRWVSNEDVDAMFSIFSNVEVMRYWSTPPLPDRDAAVALVNEIHDAFERQTMLKWGVARQADNALIGTTTLYNLDFANRRAELGYALGREYWGQGYMQEALQAVLAYCFETLDLRRLEADVDPRNEASIQTLERLGFQREGFLRERWEVGGEIQDALFYGLLQPEWKRAVSD